MADYEQSTTENNNFGRLFEITNRFTEEVEPEEKIFVTELDEEHQSQSQPYQHSQPTQQQNQQQEDVEVNLGDDVPE